MAWATRSGRAWQGLTVPSRPTASAGSRGGLRQPQPPRPSWGQTGRAVREAGRVTGPPWCQHLLPDPMGMMQQGWQGPALVGAAPTSWEAVIYTNSLDYMYF